MSVEWNFGDPDGAVLYFLLATGLGLVLGGMLYCIMAYPECCRQEYQAQTSCSKPLSALVGGLVGLTVLICAYQDAFGLFYQIQTVQDTMVVGFQFPERSVTLARQAIAKVEHCEHQTKGGSQLRLRLHTHEGRVFESATMDQNTANRIYREVETWWRNG